MAQDLHTTEASKRLMSAMEEDAKRHEVGLLYTMPHAMVEDSLRRDFVYATSEENIFCILGLHSRRTHENIINFLETVIFAEGDNSKMIPIQYILPVYEEDFEYRALLIVRVVHAEDLTYYYIYPAR